VVFGAGVAMLFAWMCFTFYDVVVRFVFDRPVPATMQLGELSLVVLTFLCVGYVHLKKAHVRVDLITSQLSQKAALAMEIGTYIACVVVLAVIIWQSTGNVFKLMGTGEEVAVLRIPLYPFSALVPIGCFLYLIMVLRDVFALSAEGLKLGLRKYQWFLALFIPVVMLVALFIWMYNPGLSPPTVGFIGIILMLALTFLGMPIGCVMALVAFTFVGHVAGPLAGYSTVGPMIFREATNYQWVAIVLFITMSYYIVSSDLGADTYDTAYKWIGHAPGGVAMATVGGSAALAAVIGDALASSVTMGAVALPQMKKYKYDDGLATGSVAAGATLGPLIPPSVPLIVYGILSETSIGRLFIGGIVPGIILTIALMATIFIMCLRNKKLGPPAPSISFGEKIKSLKLSGPIVLLFLIIIGGIYTGLFSAVEAGAIGSFCAFVLALIMKRIKTWEQFTSALINAAKMSTAVLFIITCAMSFGYVVGVSHLSMMLTDLILGLEVSPLVIVAAIIFVYFILGFVISTGIVIILTIPLFAPIMSALGIDLVWLGVLVIVTGNLGFITPPYGLILFTMRMMVPEVSIRTLYKGVLPFVLATMVVIVLLFFFPDLITWLPDMMMG